MQVQSQIEVSTADIRPIAEAAQRLFESTGGFSDVVAVHEFKDAVGKLYNQAFELGREFERRNPTTEDGDEPINAAWLQGSGIPSEIPINGHLSPDLADKLVISPSGVEIVTISGSSGFNYEETIDLPTIQTRSQLRQLIALLTLERTATE